MNCFLVLFSKFTKMKKLIYFLCIIFLIAGCRKKSIDPAPVITMGSPYENQSFNALDTVRISAFITDNMLVNSVKVSLYKYDNNKQILHSLNFSPDQKEYKLNATYPLNDLYLESGQYYFRITASDGNSGSSEYVNITINEASKVRTGAFIISSSGNSMNISFMDNQNAVSIFKTVTSDYGHSSENLYGQFIHVMGKNTGNLIALNVSDASEEWHIPFGSSFPNLFFEEMHYANKLLYVGLTQGVIRAYNNSGVIEHAFASPQGFKPGNILHSTNHLITEQKQITGQGIQISAYYNSSNALRQQLTLQGDIVAMFEINSNEILVLANEGTNGKIWVYNLDHNQLYSQKTIIGENIKCAADVGNGNYLIGIANNIKNYNLPANTLLPYVNAVNPEKIRFDNLSNKVYVVAANVLRTYDYSSTSLLHTYTHSTNIKNFHLMYNKD